MNKKKLVIHTGKQGYIKFILAVYKKLGFNEEDLKELNDKLQTELEDKLYTIQ